MEDPRKTSLMRLLNAAESKGVHGAAAVARALNVSDQAINNWKSRGVPHAMALKAQETWGISAQWIVSGEGEQVSGAIAVASLMPTPAPGEPVIHIPLLSNAGSMGPGTDIEHDDVIIGTLPISPDWLDKRIRPSSPEALRFIHAYGDSMSPTFEDGDVLLVDTGRKNPSGADGVYVLATSKRLFIKRVTEQFDGRQIVTSDNVNVKLVQELNGGYEISVLGRVVWVWHGRKI